MLTLHFLPLCLEKQAAIQYDGYIFYQGVEPKA